MTDSGRLNHKVVTHPASSLAQDRESSPVETSVPTTMLRQQWGHLPLNFLELDSEFRKQPKKIGNARVPVPIGVTASFSRLASAETHLTAVAQCAAPGN